MAKYFPKNRVIDNKYTNGDKFINPITKKPYVGYYYETFIGEFKTGKNPMVGPSAPLIPITTGTSNPQIPNNQNNDIYSVLSKGRAGVANSVIGTLKEPLPYFPKPTPQDYNRGYFTRYVAKKRNSSNSIFLEINQPTYNDLLYKEGVYNYPMWAVTSIFWQITGPLRDNRENKDYPKAGIIDTNKRILATKAKTFPSIEKFFSNLTQFAVLESLEVISGQYTSGRELEYKSNGKEYIGYYHVRGNNDVFDGATTAQSKNMLLKPINTTVAGSISLLLDKTLKEIRAQNIANIQLLNSRGANNVSISTGNTSINTGNTSNNISY